MNWMDNNDADAILQAIQDSRDSRNRQFLSIVVVVVVCSVVVVLLLMK